MSGVLHLVGVGPGDPELLTLKAARLIEAADTIAFPQKPGRAPFAFEIASAHVRPDAERLAFLVEMALDPAPARAAYDGFADKLATRVAAGRAVVYLCEGDPMFYGSAMYLFERLADRIPVEIVPGVTSLTAAAAVARHPLATRNQILKVLPAPLPDKLLQAELAGTGPAAIIKLGRHFDRIRALLVGTGRGETATVVEYATGPGEKVAPLLSLANGAQPYFSTVLVAAPKGAVE